MPLPNNFPFFHFECLQLEFSITVRVFILDKTEEGLVGELQVLILDKAEEGLVGEPGGGRGNGWHSLLPSSTLLLGESRLVPPNRGWRGDVVAPILDPGPGLLG